MPVVRTCIGCRTRGEPDGWARVAAGADGVLRVGRLAPGRGAWLCSERCFDESVRRHRLQGALRRKISDTDVAALRATLWS